MNTTQLVIFDLDGTILYTLDDLTDSLNVMLQHYNYPQRSLNEVRNFIGNGVRNLVARAIPNGVNNPNLNDCFAFYSEYYSKHNRDKTRPYEGIASVMQALKNQKIQIGILSNKYNSATQSLCEHFFKGLYNIAIGECDSFPIKPSPIGIFYMMKQFGVKPENTILIGDSEVDIQTAANAGIACLSALWGYKDKDFLVENGAKILVESPSQILEKLP